MSLWLRRFVWWKCLFWLALGGACGYTFSTLRPEPGAPPGVSRVDIPRFVFSLRSKDAKFAVDRLVIYPPHEKVRVLTFDYTFDGKTTPAYLYAKQPFLRKSDLESVYNRAAILQRIRPDDLTAVFAGRLKDTSDAALADITSQHDQQWETLEEFLKAAHSYRTDLKVTEAWWIADWWWYGVPVAAGTIVIGMLGSVLTRRSAADVLAADLLRQTEIESMPVPTGPTAADMQKVAELDAILSARLAGSGEAQSVIGDEHGDAIADPQAGEPAVRTLTGGPLEAAEEAAKEDKSYGGEFYPTVRRGGPKAFSLVELLVAIGIIGVLLALLLPTISGARRSANQVVCGTNLRSIGQGIALYLNANRQTFPPAYLYIGHKIENGVQTPTSPAAGYVHWSSYLLGAGNLTANVFTCPSMNRGGLPPTNTPPENRDPGQICPGDTVVDEQAPRLAYTVNEALCPRNKFIPKSFGSSRCYRFVKVTEVASSSNTILGTEYVDNAAAISYGNWQDGWIMSHRPVHGFTGLNGELDMYFLPIGQQFRPCTAADFDADPSNPTSVTDTRLDLVGRNHGKKSGYPDRRLSNFLYVDGHVETKSVYGTVWPTFQWGDKFYSLSPNTDQVEP